MAPKRWMILTWVAILAAVVGVCALYGGRNCEVPKSGPFQPILHGRKYVRTNSRSYRVPPCRQVK